MTFWKTVWAIVVSRLILAALVLGLLATAGLAVWYDYPAIQRASRERTAARQEPKPLAEMPLLREPTLVDLAPLAGARPADLPSLLSIAPPMEGGGRGLYEVEKNGVSLTIRVDKDVVSHIAIERMPGDLQRLPLKDLLRQFGFEHQTTTTETPVLLRGVASDPQARVWKFIATRRDRRGEGFDLLNLIPPGATDR